VLEVPCLEFVCACGRACVFDSVCDAHVLCCDGKCLFGIGVCALAGTLDSVRNLNRLTTLSLSTNRIRGTRAYLSVGGAPRLIIALHLCRCVYVDCLGGKGVWVVSWDV
jgi:hypothetical protein